ncbi:MAG TPA: hypothetical protein VMW81_01575 [Nitrospinota bacterium]|nr:hypothetical protein [Nitrospinota bacterium]
MRDDFTQQTLDILAKRVGVRCSNPSCRKLTTGPRTEETKIVNIGVGSHITAAATGGPRYDSSLSSDERKSADNGIWLCQNCAKLVDNDPVRYTVEVLREWKKSAEDAALSEIEGEAVGISDYIDLDISYKKIKILSERHDYLLQVILQNLGSDPLSSFHIDLELPARVLEHPEEVQQYMPDRSSRSVSFFRADHQTDGSTVYPGDSKVVLSIPYYIDTGIYMNRGNLFETPVRAILYRTGLQPLVIEKPFGELQFF